MIKPSTATFATALSLQVLRGLAGAFALAAAYGAIDARLPGAIWLALGLAGLALMAWRGCPTCWLMGLIGLLGSRQDRTRTNDPLLSELRKPVRQPRNGIS